jgi:DNA-binding transcriptional ArsR family regulator
MNLNQILSSESLNQASHCLKILGNATRLKIVCELSDGEKSVKQISISRNLPHNVACEHLRLLQHCGFISSERVGKEVRYKIKDTHLLDLLVCIKKRFS